MTPRRPALTPLPRLEGEEAIPSQIIRTLTEYFFSGDFLGGSRLPSERQLAESLGVSRAAVREAIQSLGLLGVVEIRQGDGTYLKSSGSEILPRVIEWGLFLGERRIMDLVEARQQIEISLAGLAARRRSDDDVARLEELHALMDAAPDAKAFVELDVEFHSAIGRAARNGALADMLSSITSLLRVWMGRSLQAAGETSSSNAEHRAIVDAIAGKDPRAAQSAMRRHLRNAEKRLRRTLDTVPGGDPDAVTTAHLRTALPQ
jgi:GntR family transcriptional repressor for pyruvate dehydrogenase complex